MADVHHVSGHCCKGSEVKGQGHSEAGGGVHFDDVASKLTCLSSSAISACCAWLCAVSTAARRINVVDDYDDDVDDDDDDDDD